MSNVYTIRLRRLRRTGMWISSPSHTRNAECTYCPARADPINRPSEPMAKIYESLQRLEKKFDNLSLESGARSSRSASASASSNVSKLRSQYSPFPSLLSRDSPSDSQTWSDSHPPRPSQASPYVTVPHKIMLWPRVYAQLSGSGDQTRLELQAMSEGGTTWVVGQAYANYPHGIPFDVGLPSRAVDTNSSQSFFFERTRFPTLTDQRIQMYTNAYFNTFNVLHPILDFELFHKETLPSVLTDGFGYGDHASILTLLVLALGELSIDAISGDAIDTVQGSSSGFRGGSAQRPPGLQTFNEARARIGSIPYRCELIDVQILLLQAFYFEANAMHVEYWRSTVSASLACHVLVKNLRVEWSTQVGDLGQYPICFSSSGSCGLHIDVYQTCVEHLLTYMQSNELTGPA